MHTVLFIYQKIIILRVYKKKNWFDISIIEQIQVSFTSTLSYSQYFTIYMQTNNY